MRNANGANLPETSTLSKSRSGSQETTIRAQIQDGTTSGIDFIFPMMDEMYKRIRLPQIIYYIQAIFVALQMFSISLWPGLHLSFLFDQPGGKIGKNILYICLFTDLSGSYTSILIRFLALTGMILIVVGITITQTFLYRKNRRFVRWTLYITRIVYEILPVISLCPLGNLLGALFEDIVKYKSLTYIIFGILSCIYFIFFVFAHYVCSYLSSVSAYLPTALTACWSGSFYFSFITIFSAFATSSYVIKQFSDWMTYLMIGIKVCFNLSFVYQLMFLPFVRRDVNLAFIAFFSAVSFLDLSYCLKFFSISFNYAAQFGIFIGSYILSYFVFSLIMKKRISRIQKVLTDTPAENTTSNEENGIKKSSMTLQNLDLKEAFNATGFDQSFELVEMAIRIGLQEMCPYFLDWSLLKYIAEFHSGPGPLCVVTQILSYFPSENRILSWFFSQAADSPELTYAQRFMLYQVHRVKGLRQSSASTEITNKLLELKRLMQKGVSMVTHFWQNVPTNSGELFAIKDFTYKTRSLFDEATGNWPNNIRLYEEYATFLIECATDFTTGLRFKHKADLIELGKNFVVDISFRSLVALYPAYLKRNVMDVKGNFIKQTDSSKRGSSNQGNNSQLSSGTIDGELDLEIEEQLAKASFGFHRLRLAFQRSLAGRSSVHLYRLILSNTWTHILSISIILFLFFYYYSAFDDRSENMIRQQDLNNIRYGYDSALISLIAYWLKGIGVFSNSLFLELARPSPKTNLHNLNFNHSLLDEVTKWSIYSRTSIRSFLDDMVELAANGQDVRTIMSEMISRSVPMKYCVNDNAINETVSSTLRGAFLYLLFDMQEMTVNHDANHWGHDTFMCEVITNIDPLISSFRRLTASMSNDQVRQQTEATKTNYTILFVIVGGFIILTFPFLAYFLSKSLSELDDLLCLMRSIDAQSRTEASKPFKADQSLENESVEAHEEHEMNKCGFCFLILVPLIIGLSLYTFIVILAEYLNQEFLHLNQWLYYGMARGNYVLESIIGTSLSIALSHYDLETNMTTAKQMAEFTEFSLGVLKTYNNNLLRGSGTLPACIDVDERLDQINFEENCFPSTGSSFQESYRCSALDHSITLFITLAKQIISDPSNNTFEADSLFSHLFHLVNVHMLDQAAESASILSLLSHNIVDLFHEEIDIAAFGGIFLICLSFIAFWLLIDKIDMAFQGAMQLLRRLPPLCVISNTYLMNFLLNKKDSKKNDKMTASQSVILMSKSAVVCLNRNESIEVVNASVSSLFGYTPEQLLGQHISTILPHQYAGEIYDSINLMRNGQSSLVFDASSTGITDSEQLVPVHITLLGIADSGSSIAKSFAIILRDETALKKQQDEAKEAKAQSEKLLYQILPRDIVTRIHSGENEISFVVPIATVIFIDIVRFSDYASTLTPSKIMENLSTIFASYDSLCTKYPLITKIKLIGDVYMAAGGLFCKDDNPSLHAQQVVHFGLDVLSAFDDINTQLDSSLQVRIGINTDGPLIGGVLGTDKPVFDIIGDPINVASRLQSTGIPNTVQISQGTYDLIQNMNFNIESRGEIELKGKGKKNAYIVRPFTGNSFMLSEFSSPSLNV